MTDEKCDLIWRIVALDQETYGGIDDPGFLHAMSIDKLRKYYADMRKQLGMKVEE